MVSLNGKSDWMINFGYRKPNSTKFYGINIGGNKEGFYMYGQTVIPFNSPTATPPPTNYGGNGISEHDLARLGNRSNSLSDIGIDYTIDYTKLTASSNNYAGMPQSTGGWIHLENGLDINVIPGKHAKSDYYGWFDIRIGVYGNTYSDYNWVQTYSYNGNSFKLDGTNNGFYYTESQKKDIMFYPEVANANMFFQDAPNATYFSAYLTLCGKTGDQWSQIATFSWGYSTINGKDSYYFYQTTNYPSSHLNNINAAFNYFNH